MTKQKTSILVDNELWKDWTLFVVNKTGSAKKLSEELEKAIRDYMAKHKTEQKASKASIEDLFKIKLNQTNIAKE